MRWKEIDRPDWEPLTQAAPLQQTWAWGEVMAAFGARIERRVLDDEGAARALAQVATRRVGPVALSLVSRGPGPEPVSTRALAALGRSLAGGRARVLVVTPDAGRGRGLVPLMTPAHLAEIDLSQSEAVRLAAMHGKWRNRLNRAWRSGLALKREDRRPERYGWLLEEEARQARARGYRGWPARMSRLWHERGGRIRVQSVWRGDERLAAMLFLLHGRVATYQIGWSGEAGRKVSAHQLCLWEAANALAAEGIARLDLGTVDTEAAPGLARFKIGSGARVRALGPTCLVPPGAGLWRGGTG